MTSEVIVAILTLVGILVTAQMRSVHRIRKSMDDVNDAVNHRHARGGAKLYDLTWENHTKIDELIGWKRGYDDGPLSTGSKVDKFVNNTNQHFKQLDAKVVALHRLIHDGRCRALYENKIDKQ